MVCFIIWKGFYNDRDGPEQKTATIQGCLLPPVWQPGFIDATSLHSIKHKVAGHIRVILFVKFRLRANTVLHTRQTGRGLPASEENVGKV